MDCPASRPSTPVPNAAVIPAAGVAVELPSGIIVRFPPSLHYKLAVGTFAESLRALEQAAGQLTHGEAQDPIPPGPEGPNSQDLPPS
jgi:hypothetical protein